MKRATLAVLVMFAAVAAASIGLFLVPHIQPVFSLVFDSTPRTDMSTQGLATSLKATFPPESVALLALSATAAVLGFAADRLR